MDGSKSFVSHPQTAVLVKPGQRAFDHPAGTAEPTTVRNPSFGEDRPDAPLPKFVAMRLRIVRAVPLQAHWFLPGSSRLPAHSGHRIRQGKKLGHVVGIGTREQSSQWDPASIGDYVVLTTGFAPIRGVWARFLPPKTARTPALSTTARDQSIWSASRSFANRTSWTRCHTPASCQACRRRQQVIPHPQPISWGRYSQGIPVFSTNRIPVNALRLSTGFRPGYRLRRGFGGGKTGSITFQRSSSRIGLAMCVPPSLVLPTHSHRPIPPNSKLILLGALSVFHLLPVESWKEGSGYSVR